MQEGEPVEDVARLAEAALCQSTVLPCSDAPSFDGEWLRRLFEACGIRRQVAVTDTKTVYGWACRGLLTLLPQVSDPGREAAEVRC